MLVGKKTFVKFSWWISVDFSTLPAGMYNGAAMIFRSRVISPPPPFFFLLFVFFSFPSSFFVLLLFLLLLRHSCPSWPRGDIQSCHWPIQFNPIQSNSIQFNLIQSNSFDPLDSASFSSLLCLFSHALPSRYGLVQSDQVDLNPFHNPSELVCSIQSSRIQSFVVHFDPGCYI